MAAVLAAGQHVFGENRVQEAQGRWAARRDGVELRLIGPLQTNKARDAVAFFDVVETVDRPKLAETLAREAQRLGRQPRLYVEINTGEEPQKAGVIPPDADAFIASCRGAFGLALEGLMCIPPQGEPPGPHFALTAKIAARNGLERLSMGMSADFPRDRDPLRRHVRAGRHGAVRRAIAPPDGASSRSLKNPSRQGTSP